MQDALLARQRAAQVAVWRADVSTRTTGRWADLGGLAAHATGLPVPYWNAVHVTAPEGLDRLDEAAAFFGELPWGVLVPEELDSGHGLTTVTEQALMLRALRDLPDVPAVELRWDAPADVVEVQRSAFGDGGHLEGFLLPKAVNDACALVVAYDDGVPVSTATLVVVEDVAAVFGVGTAPEHRGRGLGAAVTLAVLHEAVRRGCDLAFLHPSEQGHGVYARLGFEDAPGYRVYSTLAETAGAAR